MMLEDHSETLMRTVVIVDYIVVKCALVSEQNHT